MNIRKVIISIIICAQIIFISCESPNSSIEVPEFSIVALLTNNSSNQRIQIFKTATLKEKNDNPNNYFISDAIISVTENSNLKKTFYKMIVNNNANYYRPIDITAFKPGKQYILNVESNFGFATGSTILPEDYLISKPREGSIYKIINDAKSTYVIFELEWSASKGAYGYVINILYATKQIDGKPKYFTFPPSYTQSTKYKLYIQIPDNFAFGKDVIIKIMAFDQNYYFHNFRNISSAGVENALGYVGSAVIKSVKVKVEK